MKSGNLLVSDCTVFETDKDKPKKKINCALNVSLPS